MYSKMRNRGKIPLIARLLSRSGKIIFARMARLNVNISPLTVLFAEIFFLAITGGTLIIIFYPEGMGYIYYDKGYPFISYLSILYASLVLGAISFGFSLQKRLLAYATRNCLTPSTSIFLLCWCFTFFSAFGCFMLVFVQSGMEHPMISALRSENVFQIATIRSDITKAIDMGVYNLGLLFLLPLNLIISVFLLRKILLSIASFILLFLLGTFTLAKAPLAYVLIFVLIFRTVYSPLYLRGAISYLSLIILSLILLFVCTGYAVFNIQSVVKNIGDRILYGQILDLPYYFEVFSKDKVGLKSLMPPYIVGDQKSPARIVAEYSVKKRFLCKPLDNKEEEAVYARVAGVANTFFTGEAFAWAGYLGVILSPFIIMAHVAFFIYLFGKVRKTWFSVYLFSFFLYKVCIGIIGGISYFIFSSIHIVLIAFLLLLISWHYLESKNIPFFNRMAEKLCIL
jgi:hypothetical protein